MLYWPRLITIAYSITLCLDPFIPFYLYHDLKSDTITISIFLSIIYLFRSISGIWSAMVNLRPYLYGRMITALALLSSFSFIILFTLIKPCLTWSWVLLGFCSLFNGLFYQPLDILIHSAIIKILGDYRVLFYGSYLRWKDMTCILSTVFIGLLINITNENHLGLILLVFWITGMFSLSIIAFLNSDAVKPAGANQLNISDDQAPLLLKNSISLAVDQNSLYYPTYKPYSIFGEQLSHISEEDASQLDRMLTAEDSLRHVSSYDSNAPSFYSRRTAANEELHHYYSRYTEEQVLDENQEPLTVHVYALALLPLPSVTDPLIALLSKQDDEETDEELFPRNYYYYNHQQQQNNPQLMKLKNWKMTTLDITLLALGITKALLNTFLFIYVYSILDLSIMDISFLIIAHIASEMVVHFIIEKWYIHKLNLTLITTLTHISLILCCIIYPNLKAGHRITFTTLIVLQVLQAGAFQLIWSAGVDQIHVVIWNQYERMKERARVSFLFSSLGPAIGALMAGIILQPELEEYSFLFKISVAILALSFVVSWGWTAED